MSSSNHTTRERNRLYWRANIKLLAILLSIWFTVSFVLSIVLVDVLDQFQFFGFKLGFWMAQQGSIYVFVVLIFTYAWRMNQLEKQFGLDGGNGTSPSEKEVQS